MAIAVFFDGRGQSVDKYDRTLELGGEDIRNQPARSFHACFQTEDGFAVLDIWESEEDFGKFGQILGPVLQEVGIEIEPKVYRLHNTM